MSRMKNTPFFPQSEVQLKAQLFFLFFSITSAHIRIYPQWGGETALSTTCLYHCINSRGCTGCTGPLPNVPSIHACLFGTLPGGEWGSSGPLFTWVSKTCSHRSHGTTYKISHWPAAELCWCQVHLWTLLCSNTTFVLDKAWQTQKPNNKAPLKFGLVKMFFQLRSFAGVSVKVSSRTVEFLG